MFFIYLSCDCVCKVLHEMYIFYRCLIILIHIAQCGVLWRYLKLFVPVDTRYVRYEIRDLCLLRLIHAFCEAAPLLLIQVYMLLEVILKKLLVLIEEFLII